MKGYGDYLKAVTGNGYRPEDTDAYTCLTYDAVLTAAHAVDLATPRQKNQLPTASGVGEKLVNLAGGDRILGCSGTLAITAASNGNPDGE